jgi:hypothetical protein
MKTCEILISHIVKLIREGRTTPMVRFSCRKCIHRVSLDGKTYMVAYVKGRETLEDITEIGSSTP